MASPENIHTNNIIQTEQVSLRNLYIYNIHITTINLKSGHEFEIKKGKLYERVWRGER